MLVTIEKYNDESLCAIIEGDIDHHTSKKIRETIDAAVEKSNPSILKLDFSKVKFMDRSGIWLIMGRYRLMFLSKSVNESFARTTISSFITSLDPTISELTDIKTAVSEAVTNSIVHAY